MHTPSRATRCGGIGAGDAALVRALRAAGHDVISIAETSPGAVDRAVLGFVLERARWRGWRWTSAQVEDIELAAGPASAERPMEARIARLESDVAHLRTDVADIKVDVRALRDKMDTVGRVGEVKSASPRLRLGRCCSTSH